MSISRHPSSHRVWLCLCVWRWRQWSTRFGYICTVHLNPHPSLIDGFDLYTSGRPKRSTLFPICRKSMTTRKEGSSAVAGKNTLFISRPLARVMARLPPSQSHSPSECPLSASLSLLYRNNRAFATPPYLISIYPSPSSASVTLLLLVSILPIDNARAGRPAIACVRGGQVGEEKNTVLFLLLNLLDFSVISSRVCRSQTLICIL